MECPLCIYRDGIHSVCPVCFASIRDSLIDRFASRLVGTISPGGYRIDPETARSVAEMMVLRAHRAERLHPVRRFITAGMTGVDGREYGCMTDFDTVLPFSDGPVIYEFKGPAGFRELSSTQKKLWEQLIKLFDSIDRTRCDLSVRLRVAALLDVPERLSGDGTIWTPEDLKTVCKQSRLAIWEPHLVLGQIRWFPVVVGDCVDVVLAHMIEQRATKQRARRIMDA